VCQLGGETYDRRVHACLQELVINDVASLLPARLHQEAVDVVGIDGLGAGANPFDQAADGQVAGSAEDPIGGADNQIECGLVGLAEGVVAEAGPVEFAEHERTHVVLIEPLGDDAVRDPVLDVQVDTQVERGQ
jgi:hypothetical protein